jgi:hypothetical protein
MGLEAVEKPYYPNPLFEKSSCRQTIEHNSDHSDPDDGL